MEIRYAVLADSVNISQEGKVNISGIFDQVNALNFPAGHAGSSLVVALEAHQSEVGSHEVHVVFADADGNPLMETRFGFVIPKDVPDPSLPIRGTRVIPLAII